MASHGSWEIRFSQTINSSGLYQLRMQKPERLPLFFLSLFALYFNQLSICFSVGRLSSLQAIHPFTHPSADLQTLHPSISPSKSLDQTPLSPRHTPPPIIFIHVPPSLRMVYRRSLMLFIVHRLRVARVTCIVLRWRRLLLLLLIERMRHVLDRRRGRIDGD
jgi:hypothetical protein